VTGADADWPEHRARLADAGAEVWCWRALPPVSGGEIRGGGGDCGAACDVTDSRAMAR
jgi:hypothetical protein